QLYGRIKTGYGFDIVALFIESKAKVVVNMITQISLRGDDAVGSAAQGRLAVKDGIGFAGRRRFQEIPEIGRGKIILARMVPCQTPSKMRFPVFRKHFQKNVIVGYRATPVAEAFLYRSPGGIGFVES